MKSKIVHLFFDNFFLDEAFAAFDSLPDAENHFLFYTPDVNYKFKYIKRSERVEVVHRKSELKKRLCEDSYDMLVLHALRLHLSLITRIPENVKLVWLPWGFDVYTDNRGLKTDPVALRMDLYLEETRKAFFSGVGFYLKNVKDFVRQSRRRLLFNRVVSRVDYCGTVLPTEYDLLKRNRYFRAEKIDFNYCLEHDLVDSPENLSQTFQGDAILIGNSASATSNHLDVLKRLQEVDVKGRKVIVPLSYGDPAYRDTVVAVGKKIFADDYYPLLSFMPFQEYDRLLKQVSHAFFAHIRQQAMGNVYMLLAQGVKVYFSERGVAYSFLKNKGFFVYSMERDLTSASIKECLTKEQVVHNRKLLEPLVNRQYILERLNVSMQKMLRAPFCE